ncbi:MAG: GNAT family N-acetyltransferase [Betaproteobacteria bacterium]
MADLIRTASSVKDYDDFARLVAEYVDWCRDRYKEDVWFIDNVFGHQSLATELTALATSYGPPNGKTLLATRDGEIRGGVAYRKLDDHTCEMKRLFIPGRFQGQGVGRRLCDALIQAARDDGFAVMKLDTGGRLTEAIAMYRRIGFHECAPYHAYPEALLPYLVFMELPLADPATASAFTSREKR